MKMFFRLFTAFLVITAVSCGGEPEPQAPEPPPPVSKPAETAPEPVPEAKPAEPTAPKPVERPAEPQAAEEVFDPSSITKEEYDTAKTEVQQLIQKLNGIIKAKNYSSWVSYLDPVYFRLISSTEYLDRINRTERMRKANLVLKNARDYFTNVVVPSRANDRVDDIEFVSQRRVKAFTISQKGEKLRLYDLEKNVDGWKIIN